MNSPIPRLAAIHDLSGYGRASLTVAIPILSSLGVQVCPLPTAVLSSQTSGVENFTFLDLTDQIAPILDHWDKLGLRFDAVYSGFLGNPAQVELVARCIRDFLKPGGLAVVDPVLGDNGVLDPTQSKEMVEAMRWLVSRATVITPNLTEAAFLLDEAFCPNLQQAGQKRWLQRLAALGPGKVVITSAPGALTDSTACLAYDTAPGKFWRVETRYIPAYYPGTGDTFASVLTGCLLKGCNLPLGMDRAAQFVFQAIRSSFDSNVPSSEGILLESVLDSLNTPFTGGPVREF